MYILLWLLNLVILSFLLSLKNKKKFLYWYFLVTPLSLLFDAPFAPDYVAYRNAYENSYIISFFPFNIVVQTGSLTSEPLFKFYIAIFHSIGLPYHMFLVSNYLICSTLFYLFLTKIFSDSIVNYCLFLFNLISGPTVYFFSPRSSLSFTLSLFVLYFLLRKRYIAAIVLLMIVANFHMQYVPVLFFLLIGSFVYSLTKNNQRIAIAIMIFLFFLFYFLKENVLMWLANYNSYIFLYATAKSHYLFEERGIRFTSVLSTLILPCLFLFLLKKNFLLMRLNLNVYQAKKTFYFFSLILIFDFLLNILFFDNAHVAGRLSRLGDYLFFCVMIAVFVSYVKFRQYFSVFVSFLFILISIFLYPTVYLYNLLYLMNGILHPR